MYNFTPGCPTSTNNLDTGTNADKNGDRFSAATSYEYFTAEQHSITQQYSTANADSVDHTYTDDYTDSI